MQSEEIDRKEQKKIERQKKMDILILLAGAFQKTYMEDVLDFMVEALQKIRSDCLKDAATEMLRCSKYMPTVAELYDMAWSIHPEGAGYPTLISPSSPKSKEDQIREWNEICIREEQQFLELSDEGMDEFLWEYEKETGEMWDIPGYREVKDRKDEDEEV